MAKTDNQPSVKQFIDEVSNPGRREDARVLVKLMAEATDETPKNWGHCIGYGRYHYCYESGVEGDAPLAPASFNSAPGSHGHVNNS